MSWNAKPPSPQNRRCIGSVFSLVAFLMHTGNLNFNRGVQEGCRRVIFGKYPFQDTVAGEFVIPAWRKRGAPAGQSQRCGLAPEPGGCRPLIGMEARRPGRAVGGTLERLRVLMERKRIPQRRQRCGERMARLIRQEWRGMCACGSQGRGCRQAAIMLYWKYPKHQAINSKEQI